jgi:membrane protease YdiL (CAAX protease family)
MENVSGRSLVKLPSALILGLAISTVTLAVPRILGVTQTGPAWFGAFVTHSCMWILSVLVILLLNHGSLTSYGFTKGSFRLGGKIFLWVIPTAVLSVLGFVATRLGAPAKPGLGFSPLESIVFVWIYASTAEEIFTRGLLQSYLIPLTAYGINLSKKLRLSLPVLFSGLYFGLMHVVAIHKMGPPVIVLTALLGLVAGYYREKTGSLIPAIIIHALFNIGGMLPMWVLSWLLSG